MATNLIVGGTGVLGGAVVERLLQAGRPVRVLTRAPARAAGLLDRGAQVVRGSLLDRESLSEACRGADAVVAAAHALFGRGRGASVHVDGRGHRDLIDAARAAGVRHFVYISVYDNGSAYRAIPFFRIKYEIEEHLKASGLSYTILRPTAFMEQHVHLLIGEPILRKGKTMLFGRGERLRNFVAADDVARVAVRALGDPSLARQTIDIGGPENLTHMDVVRLYEQFAGRPAKVTRVPVGIPRLVSLLCRPLHPGLSQVMQAAVLAESADQTFDAGPQCDRLGFEPTRLEDWVAQRVGRPAAPPSSRPVTSA